MEESGLELVGDIGTMGTRTLVESRSPAALVPSRRPGRPTFPLWKVPHAPTTESKGSSALLLKAREGSKDSRAAPAPRDWISVG